MTEPTARLAHAPRRTGLIIGVIGGCVLLLLIIAGIIGYAMLSASHTPQKAVAAYLSALEHGDASKALQLSGMRASDSDVLLTDKALHAATNRVSDFAVTQSVVDGDSAAVTANITQGDKHYTQSFALVKTGTDAFVFDRWRLEPVALGKVVVDIEAPKDVEPTVSGVSVGAGSGRVRLEAFPGTYPVKVAGGTSIDNNTDTDANTAVARAAAGGSNAWYAVKTSDASVLGFGSGPSEPGRVLATLTDKGTQAATAAVNSYLDSCVASTAFRPDGCPFGVEGEDADATYTDQKWTLDPRPTFTIGPWTAAGWTVKTTAAGSATFSATVSGDGGSGQATAGPIDVKVVGLITAIDDSGATFRSRTATPPTA